MTATPPPTEPEREPLSMVEVRDIWPLLTPADRIEAFAQLPRDEAEDFFFALGARDQAQLVLSLPARDQRSWVRLLAPDDTADFIQAVPEDKREALLALLDDPTRREVTALLAYAEDNAVGLMNPRFARLRPDVTVDEAVSYLRRQMREQPRSIYYAYVLDADQRMLGVVSFGDLFTAAGSTRGRGVMTTSGVTLPGPMD